LTMRYDGQSGSFPPVFEGIRIDDCALDVEDAVMEAEGLPESPIRDVRVSNSTFQGLHASDSIRSAQVVWRKVSVNSQTRG
jgi:hypothetical protein